MAVRILSRLITPTTITKDLTLMPQEAAIMIESTAIITSFCMVVAHTRSILHQEMEQGQHMVSQAGIPMQIFSMQLQGIPAVTSGTMIEIKDFAFGRIPIIITADIAMISSIIKTEKNSEDTVVMIEKKEVQLVIIDIIMIILIVKIEMTFKDMTITTSK